VVEVMLFEQLGVPKPVDELRAEAVLKANVVAQQGPALGVAGGVLGGGNRSGRQGPARSWSTGGNAGSGWFNRGRSGPVQGAAGSVIAVQVPWRPASRSHLATASSMSLGLIRASTGHNSP
jgi:hypothetical protein